jgi:murein DD-endopeptidase MepM/ murein hydrolase activator NlpD
MNKKKSLHAKLIVGLACLTLLGLSACQPSQLDLVMASQVTQTPSGSESTAAFLQPTVLAAPQTVNQDDTPLQFTFPTPEPPPVSLWRPPLYAVPWALNEHDHFYFVRPIAADEVNWPLANYRYGDYFPGSDIVHTGVDIDAKRGTPVLAAGPGEVTWAGMGLYRGAGATDDPYGNAVAIRHDFGFEGQALYTIYAHMDRIDVQVGQVVKTGDQLGLVGNTGNTTGPHLHFEVRIERNSYYVTRNPELWLAPPQGWGVLVGRLMKMDASTISGLDVNVYSPDLDRNWGVRTYAPLSVNSDDYYRENLALSDLPAGDYKITFTYDDETIQHSVTIMPGAISYFTFRDGYGFSDKLPANPASQEVFTPTGN